MARANDAWAMEALSNIGNAVSQGYEPNPLDLQNATWGDFGPAAATGMVNRQIDWRELMAKLKMQQGVEQMKAQAGLMGQDIQGQYGLAGKDMEGQYGLKKQGMIGDTERELKPQEWASRLQGEKIRSSDTTKMAIAQMKQASEFHKAEMGMKIPEILSKDALDKFLKYFKGDPDQLGKTYQAFNKWRLSMTGGTPFEMPTKGAKAPGFFSGGLGGGSAPPAQMSKGIPPASQGSSSYNPQVNGPAFSWPDYMKQFSTPTGTDMGGGW